MAEDQFKVPQFVHYEGEISELAMNWYDGGRVEFVELPGKWFVIEFQGRGPDTWIRPKGSLELRPAGQGQAYVEITGEVDGQQVEIDLQFAGGDKTNPARFHIDDARFVTYF